MTQMLKTIINDQQCLKLSLAIFSDPFKNSMGNAAFAIVCSKVIPLD